MRKVLLVVIIVVPVLALVMLFARTGLARHNVELKAYFQDAQGLRSGAPVRLAGVEIGTVTTVRARPEIRDSPAEVVIAVNTPYELKIPNDSTISLATAGVLGETFPEINVQNASGPPVESGSVLKTKSSQNVSTQQLLQRLEQIAQQKPCEDANKDVTGRKK
jgi:phospholipid/cholesterol/gamma-HCH transport system substrate-binding protein